MEFTSIVQNQRAFFETGATQPLSFRIQSLLKLKEALHKNESKILAALHADLHKPAHEAYASDIALVVAEIDFAVKHLRSWMKPQRRRAPWMAWPSRARVVPNPLGVVLILGTWNYPVQLLVMPLVAAMAAGNCAILKPSEIAENTAALMADIIGQSFPDQYIAVFNGRREVAESLLRERFDSIFFTGGTQVGRAVMTAAAKHLTPVTLEMGGKCPAIACADADLPAAARRIIWAKMYNAGQSCVAPDFVLVDEQVQEPLIAELKKAISTFYGSDPRSSPDFGRIINRRRFDQLIVFLDVGRIVAGGENDPNDLYIAPTLLADVTLAAPVMNEEIFGPILPILTFKTLDEAISLINSRPSPLALYAFTQSPAVQDQITAETRSGGICFNSAIVHMVGRHLPFGGIGDSGMGNYHGKAGFDNFTHYKSVVHCSNAFDISYRYPPQKFSLSRYKKIMQFLLRH